MKFDITRSELVQNMTLILILYIEDIILIGSGPLMIKLKKDGGVSYTYRDMSLYGFTRFRHISIDEQIIAWIDVTLLRKGLR